MTTQVWETVSGMFLCAEGTGALIDLSGVTEFVGGSAYNTQLSIEALSGGTIDMRQVRTVEEPLEGDLRYRGFNLLADGAGSQIHLNVLSRMSDSYAFDFGEGLYSTIAAKNSGVINVPNLAELQGVNLELDGTATLAIDGIREFNGGRIALVGDREYVFPQLVHADGIAFDIHQAKVVLPALETANYGRFHVSGGGQLDVPALSQIDGLSFDLSDGVVVNIPLVNSYDSKNDGGGERRTWRVSGPGTKLLLPGMKQIVGGKGYNSQLYIEAQLAR